MRKISTNSQSLSMQQADRLEAIDQGIRNLKLSLQDQQADSEEPRRVPSTTHIERLTTNMKTTMTEKADALAEQCIVSSLHYSSRARRYQEIPPASRNTFEWIYESIFVDWLQNGEGVFWITGKAGSGKSTLMKYIAHHETTRTCLEKWASPKQAIIASHYFWASGDQMQKSLQGLLQAILLDLFRQCPSIIPSVVPERWRKASSESTPEQWQRQNPGQNHEAWTMRELSEALVRVGYLDDSPVRFCVFIDGLDEYSGDYLDLCDMLGKLWQSQSLKFCVSSRPLNEFESAFGSDSDKTLVIHEKTKQDIMISVQTQFEHSREWREWAREDEWSSELPKKIAEKAEGVFLWADLVTKSLRGGLENGDNPDELMERLQSIPSDLGKLFKHMLDSVDPRYHGQMAQMLQIACAAAEPLRWEIYYHNDEGNHRTLIGKNTETVMSSEQFSRRRHQTRKRINARCKGLLELSKSLVNNTPQRVQFLHRTVRDFLLTDEMTTYIASKLKSEFEASLAITRAFAAWLKTCPFELGVESGEGQKLKSLLETMLMYADQASEEHVMETAVILDDLESAIVALTKKPGWLDGQMRQDPLRVFRTCVVQGDVANYLRHKVQHDVLYLSALRRPSLYVAIRCWPTPTRTLRVLLESGEDPNKPSQLIPCHTPWCEFMRCCCGFSMTNVEGFQFALKQHIFQLFLEHGADPNDNGFEQLGGQLSAFSMFVLAAFHLMTPTWDKQSSQLYDQTLRDFLEAGASPGDSINVEPLLLRLRTCRAFQDDMSLCDDIERAQTIKAQLSRLQEKAVDTGRPELGAGIASVLGMISRFEEGADCAHVKRKASSEHDMQAGEVSKRARLSDSLICDPHVF